MIEKVDIKLSEVSSSKVQENVFRWKATNMFSSMNIRTFTSEAVSIPSEEKATFSLYGNLSYNADHGNKLRSLSFSIQRDDDKILQIAKESMLQVSVTVYNINNVEKFNCIKNIRWTDLLQKKSVEIFPKKNFRSDAEEYPENILILEATVKQSYDKLKVSQVSVLKEIKSMYKSKEFADFKIKVQNEEFLAHQFILLQSEVFQGMFRANMEETKNNVAEIKDVASEDFAELLLYMYTGNISSTKKATLELADAAERFGLIELRRFCEDYVEETIQLENAVLIFAYADLRDRDGLKQTAVDFILKNKDKFKDADLQPVFENPNFCKMLVRNNSR